MLSGARVQGFQLRNHIQPQAIAAELAIGVGAVMPNRQAQLLAAGLGVGAAKGQQGPHHRDAGAQGPRLPQAREPREIGAADQVKQQGFSPISGGVPGEHQRAAAGFRLPLQAFVTPLAGCRFAFWSGLSAVHR
jgi:hypothetical protein